MSHNLTPTSGFGDSLEGRLENSAARLANVTRPQWWLDETALDILALCEHLAARSSPNPDFIDDFVRPSGTEDPRRLLALAEDGHLVDESPTTYEPCRVRLLACGYSHRHEQCVRRDGEQGRRDRATRDGTGALGRHQARRCRRGQQAA